MTNPSKRGDGHFAKDLISLYFLVLSTLDHARRPRQKRHQEHISLGWTRPVVSYADPMPPIQLHLLQIAIAKPLVYSDPCYSIRSATLADETTQT